MPKLTAMETDFGDTKVRLYASGAIFILVKGDDDDTWQRVNPLPFINRPIRMNESIALNARYLEILEHCLMELMNREETG